MRRIGIPQPIAIATSLLPIIVAALTFAIWDNESLAERLSTAFTGGGIFAIMLMLFVICLTFLRTKNKPEVLTPVS